MRCIVTTTINEPTEPLLAFVDIVASRPDWRLVIVGDLSTPHERYRELERRRERVHYVDPVDQRRLVPELSDTIGWRCIQRRNVGFVLAYHAGAEVVATVDDDNMPLDGWGDDVAVGTEVDYEAFRNRAVDCFDPLSVAGLEGVWHRGYPIEYRAQHLEIERIGVRRTTCLVQADMWNGDPDVDALVRIGRAPLVDLSGLPTRFGSEQISPFNSQNTFLHRSVLPHYAVFPHVGRMDDIWGAYALQAVFPHSVVYHSPTVYQHRNDHDLVADLEAEILGYRQTLRFIRAGRQFEEVLPTGACEFWVAYRDTFDNAAVAQRVARFMSEWTEP